MGPLEYLIASVLVLVLLAVLVSRKHVHRYKIEGITQEGHIVERCLCGQRQLYVVMEDRPPKLVKFSKKDWESRYGKVSPKGIRE